MRRGAREILIGPDHPAPHLLEGCEASVCTVDDFGNFSFTIEQRVVSAANHFFDGKIDQLMASVIAYLDKRLEAGDPKVEQRGRRTGAG